MGWVYKKESKRYLSYISQPLTKKYLPTANHKHFKKTSDPKKHVDRFCINI